MIENLVSAVRLILAPLVACQGDSVVETQPRTVVVAVSGGADSVALLRLAVAADVTGLALVVAHLDHGLRPESAQDAQFVNELAAQLGLPCFSERIDAHPPSGASPEAHARELRYAFLQRVASQTQAVAVLTAHHADDQAETVLLRAATGTGTPGLRGLQPERPLASGSRVKLLRPLLNVRRHDLRAYLASLQQTWREDASNDDGNVRARLRQRVLPVLADVLRRDPVPLLTRLAQNAASTEALLSEVDQLGASFLRDASADGQIELAVGFERLPRALRGRLLGVALRRLRGDTHPPSRAEVERLDRCVLGDASESVARVVVSRSSSGVLIELEADDDRQAALLAPSVLSVPGTLQVADSTQVIEADEQPFDGATLLERLSSRAGTYELCDADRVCGPLTVRRARSDDRFVPLGARAAVRVSGHLSRRGVRAKERREALVVCDETGVIWVVGHALSDRVRLAPTTRRVLRLRTRFPRG